MPVKRSALQIARRVAAHRSRRKQAGWRRLEISVPPEDAVMLQHVATILRSGGASAEALRSRIAVSVDPVRSTSGVELVDFFRRSPVVGIGLDLDRDRSAD